MADNQNQTPNRDNEALTWVSTHEPESRDAPALQVGWVLWVRENLFGSMTNTALTFVGLAIVILSLINISTWIVQTANWYSITANFRQFMVGFYELEYEWRVTITLLYSVFFVGAAVAIWVKQIARTMMISIIALWILTLVFPLLVIYTQPAPSLYVTAGNMDVVSGSSTENPIERLAFTAREGEVITIQLADELTADDQSLAAMSGYVDRASNTLRNAAEGRLEGIERAEWLEATLEEHNASEVPILTEAQAAAYSEELAEYEEEGTVVERFNVNQMPIEVTIVDGSNGNIVSEATVLGSNDDVVEVTVPADGWYILEKVAVPDSAEVAEAVTVLQIFGIYPVLQSTTLAPDGSGFADVFNRTTDTYRERERPPEDDDNPISLIVITENQYRGTRSLSDYLRAYVAPFLLKIGIDFSILLFVGVLGYWVAKLIAAADGRAIVTTATAAVAGLSVILWAVVSIDHPVRLAARNVWIDFSFPEQNAIWFFLAFWVSFTGLMYAVLRSVLPPNGKEASGRFTAIGFALVPIVFWVLINGMYAITAVMWLLVLSMTFISLLIFQLGRKHGWTEIPFAVAIVSYTAFVAVLLLSGDFDLPRYLSVYTLAIDPAGVPRLILWISIAPMLFAAFSGAGLHIPGEEVKVRWAVYGGLALELFIIAAVMAVSGSVSINTEWPLQPSDPLGWGGLLLAMALTIYGIIIAFPIGIGLALGRRSDLPVIKYLCTAYIELVRGSPLITVLFFIQLLVPLVNSELAEVSNTYRAMIAIILFSAAYLAENVRGGLQSLPPGQNEAAQALGLSTYQATMLITLPQALRAVIPALVGQFISLFKDTSLVAIVGLFDLVKFVNTVAVQAEFFGTRLEGLFFISILYFVFSYVMSYVSRLLEASGSGSTRRM